MIHPLERKPNPILALPTVRLFVLVAFVNHDGNLEDRDGFAGEIIDCSALSISEGAVWTPLDGDYVGEVLQNYPRAKHLLQTPERIRMNGHAVVNVSLVVASFAGGILGAHRAMHYATERVLTDLEAFHGLVTLSDEALDHAIGSNLKESVSVRQHLENIAELEALVRSGGVLANEIREFLEAIKSPKDRRKRHNVYRMVLITRAVQRRAKVIAEGKGNTLEAVTVIGLDVARYVGATTALAAQIITELKDEQPWWTGSDGDLPHRTAVRRRKNFIARLRQYRTELLAITAKPFCALTFHAAAILQNLANCIQEWEFGPVHADVRLIITRMEGVLELEKGSRAIMASRRAR